MGSTLTNTQPKDTYKSLLKTSDSTELSATAKYVSDGNGNDSPLALSTSNVGIGTSSPAQKLDVAGTLRVSSATPTEEFFNTTNGDVWASIFSQASGTGSGASLVFSTKRDGNSATDKMTITQAGNVGIGTSSPAGNLHIASASDTGIRIQAGASNLSYIDLADTASGTPAGSIAYNHIVNAITFATGTNVERARIDSDGLKFNGDTAAANALDDYEEGTFTPVFKGATTAGSYSFSLGGGSYVKIGRQVTIWISMISLNQISAGSGVWKIDGLPFVSSTDLSIARNSACAWIRRAAATRNNIIGGVGNNASYAYFIYDANASGAGTDFTIAADYANNMDIGLQTTYFV